MTWTRSRAAALSPDALDNLLAAYYSDEIDLSPDDVDALESEQESRDYEDNFAPRDEPTDARDSALDLPTYGA